MADGGGFLSRIAVGSEESKHVLVEDSIHHNGRPLLVRMLYNLSVRYSAVQVALTDSTAKDWIRYIDSTKLKNVHFFHIPMKWIDRDATIPKLMDLFPFHQSGSEDVALVVDNLSTLLSQYNYTEVCRDIQVLGLHYCSVHYLLHYDVHEDHVIRALHHMMSSIVRVVPNCNQCSILHKRKSGKIIRETEVYSLNKGSIHSHQLKEEHVANNQDIKQVDPAANLTFDLHLSEQEKLDRSRVILPYTQVQIHDHKGTGQILYQLDEVDDWDESDPDDDLDI